MRGTAKTCVPERDNFDIKIDCFISSGFLAFAMIETNLNLTNGSTNTERLLSVTVKTLPVQSGAEAALENVEDTTGLHRAPSTIHAPFWGHTALHMCAYRPPL